MSIPDFNFNPTEGWNNTTEFPDYPARDQVRPLFQRLFDQIRDFINTSVKGTVNTHLADNMTAHGIDLKANKAQGNWINATPLNGWSGSIQYMKNDLGQVFIRTTGSALTSGTIATGTVIITLPVGYRPVNGIPLIMHTITSSPYKAYTGLFIRSDGNLCVYPPANTELTTGLTGLHLNTVFQVS